MEKLMTFLKKFDSHGIVGSFHFRLKSFFEEKNVGTGLRICLDYTYIPETRVTFSINQIHQMIVGDRFNKLIMLES